MPHLPIKDLEAAIRAFIVSQLDYCTTCCSTPGGFASSASCSECVSKSEHTVQVQACTGLIVTSPGLILRFGWPFLKVLNELAMSYLTNLFHIPVGALGINEPVSLLSSKTFIKTQVQFTFLSGC